VTHDSPEPKIELGPRRRINLGQISPEPNYGSQFPARIATLKHLLDDRTEAYRLLVFAKSLEHERHASTAYLDRRLEPALTRADEMCADHSPMTDHQLTAMNQDVIDERQVLLRNEVGRFFH